MKLTKVEREFIRPAINNDWTIQSVGNSGLWAWDGDSVSGFYVKVGAVCKNLVAIGVLEYINSNIIRKTKLAEKFSCSCDSGKIHEWDDEYYEIINSEKCEVCDGTGVMLTTTSKE